MAIRHAAHHDTIYSILILLLKDYILSLVNFANQYASLLHLSNYLHSSYKQIIPKVSPGTCYMHQPTYRLAMYT